MEVYSMDSIIAIFNFGFCDYGTVLVHKNKTTIIYKSCVTQNTWQISK